MTTKWFTHEDQERLNFEEGYQTFLDEEGSFHDLLEDASNTDPALGLGAIGFLNRWLSDRERDLVLKARIGGFSWADIGHLLGRSKQAVWEKHRDPQDADAEE